MYPGLSTSSLSISTGNRSADAKQQEEGGEMVREGTR